MNEKVIIVGHGEVGRAIERVEQDAGHQITVVDKQYPEPKPSKYSVMHVCIPYGEDFVTEIKRYYDTYQPDLVIIHSTVEIGTTRKIGDYGITVVHSPVRGIHPNLYDGVRTFTKYIGGKWLGIFLAKQYLESLGLTVEVLGTYETTEMAKLLSTSYYGMCIMFAKQVYQYCNEYGLDYNSVYTRWNKSYNDGYKELGKENVVRPILTPPEGRVGGHCITSNFDLLPPSYTRNYYRRMNRSDNNDT